jgi:hypothetical protein
MLSVKKVLLWSLFLTLCTTHTQAGESGKKTIAGKTYELVRGQFTQKQAWDEARSRGGIPVVFETMEEHRAVVSAFKLGLSDKDICHTGVFQLASAKEPGRGWEGFGKRKLAPLCKLFNSEGPDDGIRRKWGFCVNCDGNDITITTEKIGKDEDCGVIWKDAGGLLEDVSVNHKANVLIEY